MAQAETSVLVAEKWMLVWPEQANLRRGCGNCGVAIGGIHQHECYEAAKARQHVREHLTDGQWHDNCEYCQRRRRRGGMGLSAVENEPADGQIGLESAPSTSPV